MNNSFYISSRDLLIKQHLSSIMQLPRIVKITLNSSPAKSIVEKKQNSTIIPYFVAMSIFTGQKPVFTRAKKSLASFKLRKGQLLGCKVTLRRQFLFIFFKLLVHAILPQIRDFTKKNINKLSTSLFVSNFEKRSFSCEKNQHTLSFGITSLMAIPHLEDFYDIFHSSTPTGFFFNIKIQGDFKSANNFYTQHFFNKIKLQYLLFQKKKGEKKCGDVGLFFHKKTPVATPPFILRLFLPFSEKKAENPPEIKILEKNLN